MRSEAERLAAVLLVLVAFASAAVCALIWLG